MADYKVISADSHVEEPDEIFDNLPPEYRDRRPRFQVIEGTTWLVVDDQAILHVEPANPLKEEDRRKGFRKEGENIITAGNFGIDISKRLADINEDGVSAEVVYPNGIFKVFASPDPGYQLAMAQLYNNYYFDQFGDHGDTFVLSAMIPTIDIEAAIDEVKRVHKQKYRSVSVPVKMPSRPYNKRIYDPLWATVQELGIPMSFHVFTPSEPFSVDDLKRTGGANSADGIELFGLVQGMADGMNPLLLLSASGALDRYPEMKFVLVECGTGWLAWALYALDDMYDRRHMWHVPKLQMKPSEYFKRQGYITFGDDPVGLHNIEFTGADSMMWGSDYPHDEGTFPHSREVIEETFKVLSEEDKRKIAGGNAAKLYGFSVN